MFHKQLNTSMLLKSFSALRVTLHCGNALEGYKTLRSLACLSLQSGLLNSTCENIP